MKKYIFIAVIAVAAVIAAVVTAKPALKLESTTFSVDIRCQNCVDRITANLPELCPGIFSINADLATRKVTVTCEQGTQSPESLIEGFRQLHFKASADAEVEVSGGSCGGCDHADGENCGHDKPAAPDSVAQSLPGKNGRPYCKIPPMPRP